MRNTILRVAVGVTTALLGLGLTPSAATAAPTAPTSSGTKAFNVAALQGATAAARASCRALRPSMRSDRTFDLLMTHNLGSGYKGRPFAFVVKFSNESDLGTWQTRSVKTYTPNRHAVHIAYKVPRGWFISEVRGGCAGSTATAWRR